MGCTGRHERRRPCTGTGFRRKEGERRWLRHPAGCALRAGDLLHHSGSDGRPEPHPRPHELQCDRAGQGRALRRGVPQPGPARQRGTQARVHQLPGTGGMGRIRRLHPNFATERIPGGRTARREHGPHPIAETLPETTPLPPTIPARLRHLVQRGLRPQAQKSPCFLAGPAH